MSKPWSCFSDQFCCGNSPCNVEPVTRASKVRPRASHVFARAPLMFQNMSTTVKRKLLITRIVSGLLLFIAGDNAYMRPGFCKGLCTSTYRRCHKIAERWEVGQKTIRNCSRSPQRKTRIRACLPLNIFVVTGFAMSFFARRASHNSTSFAFPLGIRRGRPLSNHCTQPTLLRAAVVPGMRVRCDFQHTAAVCILHEKGSRSCV